jgi:TfoX/Sxy family transcriptional regulator of competence genes
MADIETLVNRVRELIAETHDITEEKKMFGGVCFMVNDKMCVGLAKEKLMVRFHPDRYDEIMERDNAEPMDFTGKVMKGYVFVDPENLKTRRQLAFWIGLALAYNEQAPASKKKSKGPVKKNK